MDIKSLTKMFEKPECVELIKNSLTVKKSPKVKKTPKIKKSSTRASNHPANYCANCNASNSLHYVGVNDESRTVSYRCQLCRQIKKVHISMIDMKKIAQEIRDSEFLE